MNKSVEAFRTIGEVADELDVPKHVLRFWEGKFPQIRPMKRGGGRRYYRPEDMELLRGIRHLLHAEGYTIKGVQKILREQGVEQVKTIVRAAMEASAAHGGKRRTAKILARNDATKPAPTAGIASASKTVTPPATAVTAQRASRDVITAAIKELQICRALLAAAPNVKKVDDEPKRLRAGRS